MKLCSRGVLATDGWWTLEDMGQPGTLAKVARMYYLEDRTQGEIARELGISRVKVCRLLRQAREQGYVRISIVDPDSRDEELSDQLSQRFGLREAVVVAAASIDRIEIAEAIAPHAALVLAAAVREGDLVGVCGGETMLRVASCMARSFAPGARVRGSRGPDEGGAGGAGVVQGVGVVQLEGSPSGKGDSIIHLNRIATSVAAAFRGTTYFLTCPAIAGSKEARAALASDPGIREVLELGRKARVAIFGVGAPGTDSVFVEAGYLSAAEIVAMRERGLAGDVCSHFITANGEPLDPALEERTVGIGLDDLRLKEVTIVVAGGRDKVTGLAGVLRGGYANTVVTDSDTAARLLELVESAEGDGPSDNRLAGTGRRTETHCEAGVPVGR